jgi:hypothetical protein
MIVSAPLNLILVAVLGPDVPPPWTAAQTALIIVFKGAEGGVMGLGTGLGQWLVFRKHLMRAGGWIPATGLAFALQGAFRWSLPYETLALQVGVDIMLSFGVFLGIFQWLVLRGRVSHAGWWIAISIAGWLPALALMVGPELAQFPIESTLGWGLFALAMLLPFAVAGGGMVWLLRQAPARQAFAS